MEENVYKPNQHRPYWKRVYNGLGIWIFLYLMIIGSGFYIIAVDFSFESHQQMEPQSKNLTKSLTNPTNEYSKLNKQNTINRSEIMVADDKRTAGH